MGAVIIVVVIKSPPYICDEIGPRVIADAPFAIGRHSKRLQQTIAAQLLHRHTCQE